ncbi:MAG: WD40 repeat domain-containing protein, partial [Planctomycetales bacterium]|nr:WD40 repeat domain-containing protein [Planctomycetales bacterium]
YKKEKDAASPDRFSAYYAERDHDGAWGPLRFVQEDASCVTFTPDGARLVVGGTQGQVSLLRLEITPAGLDKHNMLTLTGHADRVSVVKFAGGHGGLTLLSGDASGRVLLNLF